MSKKVMIMLLRLFFTCLAFFGLGDAVFPLEGLSLRLRVVTVNPALITSDDPRQECFIVGGELTKFSADDALLLLVSCQDPGQKFECDSAFPILPSEPVGMSRNQLPPPQQCREWSDVNPDR